MLHLAFAILAWGFPSAIAAGAGGAILSAIVYLIERKRPPVRTKWIAAAALLPLAAVLYVWGSFTVYAAVEVTVSPPGPRMICPSPDVTCFFPKVNA